LVANVGLTAAKGAAGWYMHSAALLADAGHSLSGMSSKYNSHIAAIYALLP
jgi:divalent metal cation (Fe/Co/Zn/Cd) transporter